MITSGFSLAFNGKALLNNSKEMLWQRNIYNVTTSTDGHGTITASPMSGYQGTTVSLSNTPDPNYNFTGYSVTGATLTGNQFTLNNDVTARAEFAAMPLSQITYYRGTSSGNVRWYIDNNGRSNLDLSEVGTGPTAYMPISTQKGVHITAAQISSYSYITPVTSVGIASSYTGPYITVTATEAIITGFDWVITGQIYASINSSYSPYMWGLAWFSGYIVE